MSSSSTTIQEVDLSSIISAKDLEAIRRVFPDGPKGKFIKARFGVTHYVLEEPNNHEGPPSKLVVMAHGLGTNLHVYDDLSAALLQKGYSVLRYDYFNHGFSVSDNVNLKMDDTVMVAQAHDLLKHITLGKNCIHAFVGHSTGGIVAILASLRLEHYNIPKLALVSPALWATKNVTARVADKVPGVLNFLLKVKDPLSRNAVKDSYMANTHIAFAKNKEGEYNYPQAYEKALEGNRLLFRYHPYIINGVGSVNCYFLRGDLLEGWRDALKECKTETIFIIGKGDAVVKYDSPHLSEMSELEHVQVVPLEGQGHESLYEDTKPIAKAMIEFFE